MRSPILITFVYLYFLLIILGNTTIARKQNPFVNFIDAAAFAHVFTHINYAILFLWSARTQNPTRYGWTWVSQWYIVPLLHWLFLELYKEPGLWQFGFIADAWLGVYWYVHVRILSQFNMELL